MLFLVGADGDGVLVLQGRVLGGVGWFWFPFSGVVFVPVVDGWRWEFKECSLFVIVVLVVPRHPTFHFLL
jgi:hypothetical protein